MTIAPRTCSHVTCLLNDGFTDLLGTSALLGNYDLAPIICCSTFRSFSYCPPLPYGFVAVPPYIPLKQPPFVVVVASSLSKVAFAIFRPTANSTVMGGIDLEFVTNKSLAMPMVCTCRSKDYRGGTKPSAGSRAALPFCSRQSLRMCSIRSGS